MGHDIINARNDLFQSCKRWLGQGGIPWAGINALHVWCMASPIDEANDVTLGIADCVSMIGEVSEQFDIIVEDKPPHILWKYDHVYMI